MTRITSSQYKAEAGWQGKRSKFGNRRVCWRGVWFDSQAELNHWLILLDRQKRGKISGLERQVAYRLDVNGVHICKYIADFVYFDNDTDRLCVVDKKGYKTHEYKLKKKLMLACHDIEIIEV